MDLKKTSIGIEFGSTRIKAVLINLEGKILCKGSFEWENKFENGYWTYSLQSIKDGLQATFKSLKDDFKNKYNDVLSTTGSLGISAMMHGYLVFDKDDNLLTPFRTWRNVNAEKAAKKLTKLFNYHIPARWSIAHLYQALIDNEKHVKNISFMTTLEGYVHYLLTKNKVIGIGEASGMFPLDEVKKNYDEKSLQLFDEILKDKSCSFALEEILPRVLLAGENAGILTKEGALLLDPTGEFIEGVKLCPPEGDAETGMVATNSIKKNTGNISTGTSIFLQVVLDKKLKKAYPEIDLVATPMGDLVAMVHANNCTSEINACVSLADELLKTFETNMDKNELITTLFKKSLEGDDDASNIISFNYLSGESLTKVNKGYPLMFKYANSNFNLANIMRTLIYSSFMSLLLGYDILLKEGVKVDEIAAHGGLLKTQGVAQKYLASGLNCKVSVNESATEGGAYGIALLAALLNVDMSLEEYLDNIIFKNNKTVVELPDEKIIKGINKYKKIYKKALKIERILSEEF